MKRNPAAAHEMMNSTLLLALTMTLLASFAAAQRKPVLGQIDLPHAYYYREMYLPQLTTGPSSAAWSPDSSSLVYSMAGSLWRQEIRSNVAQEITAGPGYDYQPDWSHDGRWIVFASYRNNAVELHALEVATGKATQLTSGGNVDVEPRFSPDGKRIAFVSTAYNRRFHIFVADFAEGALSNVRRITGENRSSLPRYYYSQFDTEIGPAWSPDGREIIFMSNRGHMYGSGGFWRMNAQPAATPREIHYEETTWKSRGDWSPDGRRFVYGSYLGRQRHQLWIMPSEGGDAFPLTYAALGQGGEPVPDARAAFDNVNPRWSPDGAHIAFISNRTGNTALWVLDFPGARQYSLAATQRRYLRPMGKLSISILDSQGAPTPARVSILAGDLRAYAPDDLWMHADDSFDPAQPAFEVHYFHSPGRSLLTVPAGPVTVEVAKGLEHAVESRKAQVSAGAVAELTFQLHSLSGLVTVPGGFSRDRQAWASADLHVHMNYAGAYRNTPQHLAMQGEAENLAGIEDLVVNKEQRFPDLAYFGLAAPASPAATWIRHDQEFHTSYWGHLGLLHLASNLLLPGYAGYPLTAAASLVPTNGDVADLAHAQRGLVGYVHPFESLPDPLKPDPLTDELPVDVALGKVDYIEVVGFSDHKSTATVWYKLLNCGFRLPTGAGTDAMANFASLRGPVGLNRVYAQLAESTGDPESWLEALHRGRSFATNGPLLAFTLAGQGVGGEVNLSKPQSQVKFTAWMRSVVPVDHLQVVCDGEVVREVPISGNRDRADFDGTLPVNKSGWCVLRAFGNAAQHPILDLYPYATTSPIYLSVAGAPVRSPSDAQYFVRWIDRLLQEVRTFKDWNTPAEQQSVLQQLSRARQIYASQLQ
jgi:TolB protein